MPTEKKQLHNNQFILVALRKIDNIFELCLSIEQYVRFACFRLRKYLAKKCGSIKRNVSQLKLVWLTAKQQRFHTTTKN